MLCRIFKLIPIKIEFLMNFQSCFKVWPKSLLPSFVKNDKERILHFYYILHVLMFCRIFKLIPIKIYEFSKLLQNLTKVPLFTINKLLTMHIDMFIQSSFILFYRTTNTEFHWFCN